MDAQKVGQPVFKLSKHTSSKQRPQTSLGKAQQASGK